MMVRESAATILGLEQTNLNPKKIREVKTGKQNQIPGYLFTVLKNARTYLTNSVENVRLSMQVQKRPLQKNGTIARICSLALIRQDFTMLKSRRIT